MQIRPPLPVLSTAMAKLNQSIRMALEIFVSENVDNFMEWLRAIEDPKEKCDIFIKLLRYYVPVLSHVTGNMTVKHSISDFTDEELMMLAKQHMDAYALTHEPPSDPSGPERRDN